MPANNPIPNTANMPTHNLAASLLTPFLGTFRGWVTRYAVRLTGMLTIAITAGITGKWMQIEEIAAKAGASAETLADLHAQGVSLSTVVAGVIASLIMGGVDIILSRLAAKIAEVPVDVYAIPTEQTP